MPLSEIFSVVANDGAGVCGIGSGRDAGVLAWIIQFLEGCCSDGRIGGSGENQTEVSVVATTQGSGN